MENKISKGKWRISNSGAFIESENGVIAAVSLSTQENINNAKLIAAAPELIEILIKMCEFHEKNATWDKGDNGYYEAKRIIKKVTE